MPMYRGPGRVSLLMLLGSSETPGPCRKSLHAVAPSARAATTANAQGRVLAVIVGSPRRRSAVEGEGEDERARLGIVEVVDPPHRGGRAQQRGLGIDPGVLGPGDQVT